MDQAEPGVNQSVQKPLLPLAHLRVLSLEQYGAGPYASMFLAQLGAEVIKIEPPQGGDTSRATGPYFLGDNDSLFYQTFNLNKRSLTLDLKSAAGREIFDRLVPTAHAVINNLRGDIPAKLKLTYDDLKHLNPMLVCGHLSAYGRDNERASWPGYDYLMQAEAGFMAVTGEPDGPPQRFGLSMVDFMTGMQFAVGITSALLGALQTGRGMDVDASLLDTALHQLSYPAMWYLNAGHVVERTTRSSHPYIVPSQMMKTSDGWIFIMAQLPKFYTLLVNLLGRSELAHDARYADVAARFKNKESLIAELEKTLSGNTTSHWISILGGKVPCAPVNDIPAALENPFMHANGMITPAPHPDQENMRALANPLKLNGERLPTHAAPGLSADSTDILAELGYTPSAIADLQAARVI
jgi:crotonobetainyl-CoA:carnitine CoA-transferase CaiB-like acyl-CoA transferase